MYIVKYNGSPNEAINIRHKVSLPEATTQFEKRFENYEEAVEFIKECTDPITKKSDILNQATNSVLQPEQKKEKNKTEFDL